MAKPKSYTSEDAFQIANTLWETYKASGEKPGVSGFLAFLKAGNNKTSSGTDWNAGQISAILDEHGKGGELVKRPRKEGTTAGTVKAPKPASKGSEQLGIDSLLSAFLPQIQQEEKSPEEVEREKLRSELSSLKLQAMSRLTDLTRAIEGVKSLMIHVDRLAEMNETRSRSTMTIRELLRNPNRKPSDEAAADAEAVEVHSETRVIPSEEEEGSEEEPKKRHGRNRR